MDILTREEIHWVDQQTLSSGLPLQTLILQVGKGLAQWFFDHITNEHQILILVGPGNNGNDGLALAQWLIERGYFVNIVDADPSDAQGARRPLRKAVEDRIIHEGRWDQYHVIVDALFGIGLDRPLKSPYKELVEFANKQNALKVAIDIPSGVDCNSGALYEPCFEADHTLTVAASKPGLHLLPGMELCGQVEVIEIEPLMKQAQKLDTHVVELSDQSDLLKKIETKASSHKYNRGTVSVVLCNQYPGAALIAAYAAQHAGAGYVQVYCPQEKLELCQVQHPDLVFKAWSSVEDLEDQLMRDTKSHTVVMGPGWDLEAFSVADLLQTDKRFVFDGGLLHPDLLEELIISDRDNFVVTPHIAELKRFLGEDSDKWHLAQKFTKACRGVLIAKGYDTLVVQRDQPLKLTTWNSKSLSFAGSGDILAGLVGSFLCQGLSPQQSACLAVDIHRKAASQWSQKTTPELLMAAITDLINPS